MTVYGSAGTSADAMPALLADRGITWPVLLDPTSAYREATKIAVYPTVTLMDGDGRIVWQGDPYWRKAFADACEARVEALLGTGAD